MKHPDFLDNRDFTGEDKKRPSTMSMDSSYQALEGAVKKLSEIASTRHDPRYLQEYIKTGINMAQSAASDHDFTVLIRSGREMYRANCVFAPYRHIRKISVFGSARIRNDEPAYETAREFAREASEHGYMVITGGGPGIMQAANEGAGEQRSFGLNITLPYEQTSNHVVAHSDKLINFSYIFLSRVCCVHNRLTRTCKKPFEYKGNSRRICRKTPSNPLYIRLFSLRQPYCKAAARRKWVTAA